MRNRLYGGVRGQVNTKRGEHLRLVFTSYSIMFVIQTRCLVCVFTAKIVR